MKFNFAHLLFCLLTMSGCNLKAFRFSGESGLVPLPSDDSLAASLKLTQPTVTRSASSITCSVTYDETALTDSSAKVIFSIFNKTKAPSTARSTQELSFGNKSASYSLQTSGSDADAAGDNFSCEVKVSSSKISNTAALSSTSTDYVFSNSAPSASADGQNGSASSALSFTVTGTDSDNDTLSYSCVSFDGGACPSTISISSGTVSWTPTSSQTGSHTIVIRVSDGISTTDIEIPVYVSSAISVTEIPTRPTSLPKGGIYDLFSDGTKLYVATGAGLAICNTSGASCTWKTVANGLPSNFVHSIYVVGQTLYIGTSDGLTVLKQGYAPTVVRRTDVVKDVIVEDTGTESTRRVYIMSDTGGASKLFVSSDNGTNFTEVSSVGSQVASLSYDSSSSKIYVATQDKGLWYVNYSSSFSTTQVSGISSTANIASASAIGSVIFAAEGTSGTPRVLKSVDGGATFSGSTLDVNGSSTSGGVVEGINSILIYDNSGSYGVVVAFDGVESGSSTYNVAFSTDSGSSYTYRDWSTEDDLMDHVYKSGTRIYAYSETEAFHYTDDSTGSSYTSRTSTAEVPSYVKDIALGSSSSTMYFAFNEGVHITTDSGSTFSKKFIYDAEEVTSVAYCSKDSTTNLLVGVSQHETASKKGLYMLANATGSFNSTPVPTSSISGKSIYSIAVSSLTKAVFVGSEDGLYYAENCGSQFSLSSSLGAGTIQVNDIDITGAGDVLAVTESNGLYVQNNGSVGSTTFTAPTFTNHAVTTMGLAGGTQLSSIRLHTNSGTTRVYIGTKGSGVVVCDAFISNCQTFTTSHGLPSNTIRDITVNLSSSASALWVTTDKGIAYSTNFGTLSFTALTTSDGMPSNDMWKALEVNGTMWFGGRGGIAKKTP